MAGEEELNIVKQAGVHHRGRAFINFLGRLEDDFDRTGQGRFPLLQQERRAKHAGRVEIVAAGVHDARSFRGIGQAGLFLNRESVDIGPKRDDGRSTGSDNSDQACFKAGVRQPDVIFLKDGAQTGRRPVFVPGKLGMTVQPLKGFNELLLRKRLFFRICCFFQNGILP